MSRPAPPALTGTCGLLVLLLAGCAAQAPSRPATPTTQAAVAPAGLTTSSGRPVASAPTARAAPDGLGPGLLARIPDRTRQLVVVTGEGPDSSQSSVVLWQRDATGLWNPGQTWPAHNGRNGWTEQHREGDLRSPEGVFTLSDAGGRLPDPRPDGGLPYHRSDAFSIGGTGFLGEPLAGSFDYVVAIDFNRKRGRSPLDPARPEGTERGGGIWLHVDHGGPTHACITVATEHMAQLIRELNPDAHPAVAMGTTAFLAK
ncbi:L,D-transpeptidase family protein [Kitasatospora camelliae]|uniref:L,D-transpeptidase family protein n=1 Tax=Kitasatospora camelliae TaxID=3156397 RepID=A0AAU8JQW4_9ACTN